MAHVFVTGAKGLLGSTLVPYLARQGHEVTCHARRGGSGVIADLADAHAASAALDGATPDVIVNLAALTDVDACEASPQAAYLANVRIVENLASWIRTRRPECHLVQVSTDQVYDGPGLHDEHEAQPANYYALSKYAGELAAAAVSGTVVRTNFVGPSACPGRSAFGDWVVAAARQLRPIVLFEDVRFSPLSLPRLAAYIERVIARRVRGTYNVGARDGMSKADFAYALATAAGLPTSSFRRGASSDAGLRARRPRNMCMDPSLFERTFEVAMPTLQQEIAAMGSAYAET